MITHRPRAVCNISLALAAAFDFGHAVVFRGFQGRKHRVGYAITSYCAA